MADNGFKVNKSVNLNPQTAAPANPVDGDFYYDATIASFVYYHSGSWANFDSVGTVAAATNLTATQFTPSIVQNSIVKITGVGATSVHGLSASFSAKKLTVYNGTDSTSVIKYQSVTEPTANNRIVTPTAGDLNLLAGEIAQFVYDVVATRWLLVSISSQAGAQLPATTTILGLTKLHTAPFNAAAPVVATVDDSTMTLKVTAIGNVGHTAIWGIADTNSGIGVLGECQSSDDSAIGVVGRGSSGSESYGVVGSTESVDGHGVFGIGASNDATGGGGGIKGSGGIPGPVLGPGTVDGGPGVEGFGSRGQQTTLGAGGQGGTGIKGTGGTGGPDNGIGGYGGEFLGGVGETSGAGGPGAKFTGGANGSGGVASAAEFAGGDVVFTTAGQIKGMLDPTAAQDAATKAYTDTLAAQNFIINGRMDFWQREISRAHTTLNARISADRWKTWQDTASAADMTVSQEATDVPSFAQYALKVLRAPASAQSGNHFVVQEVDREMVLLARGKLCTLTFWAKCGVNYTPFIGTRLHIEGATGTNPTQYWDPITNSYTTGNVVLAGLSAGFVSLSTTWTKFSVTFTPDSGAKAMVIGFRSVRGAFSGGANDSWFVTGVRVHLGEPAANAVDFVFHGRNIAGELAACQRYFEKSMSVIGDTGAPTLNLVPPNTQNGRYFGYLPALATLNNQPYPIPPIRFVTPKRSSTPTITLYPTDGSPAGSWTVDGTERITTTADVTDVSFQAYNGTGGTVTAATTFRVEGHWTADAEF